MKISFVTTEKLKGTSEQREIQLYFLIIKIVEQMYRFLLFTNPGTLETSQILCNLFFENGKAFMIQTKRHVLSKPSVGRDTFRSSTWQWLLALRLFLLRSSGSPAQEMEQWHLRCPGVRQGYETKGTVLLGYYTNHNVLPNTPLAHERQMQWLWPTASEQRTVQENGWSQSQECFQKSQFHSWLSHVPVAPKPLDIITW